jgi:hypothetical protein
MWMKWHKKGGAVDFKNPRHEQFFNIMFVRVESQHTHDVESVQDVEHVLDDSDASSADGVDGDEDPML